MIYLDNAATALKKPRCVSGAVCKWIECGNPGRGSHSVSIAASEIIYNTRLEAARLFNAAPEKVVFTQNATAALNCAIKGVVSDGATIVTSDFEHNSVRRPVSSLCRSKGCKREIIDTSESSMALSQLRSYLSGGAEVVVCIHKSNITGRCLPIAEMGRLCRERGAVFIVDASQSAGNTNIDVERDYIDILCCAGHKGLMGPQGSGMLVLGRDIRVKTLLEGGSGSSSLSDEMPSELPDRLEAGTLSTPAIAGLGAGIRFVRGIGVDNIGAWERRLWHRCRSNFDRKGIIIYDKEHPGANFLFNVEGKKAAQVAYDLDKLGICVRQGLHCAPDAHRSLGTENMGAVRASFGFFTTEREVDELSRAVLRMR